MLVIIAVPLSVSALKPDSRGGMRRFRSGNTAPPPLARPRPRKSKPSSHTIPEESKDPKTNLRTSNLLVRTGSTHSGAQMKIKTSERSERLAVTPEGSIPTSPEQAIHGSQLCFQIFPTFPAQEREVPFTRCFSQHVC